MLNPHLGILTGRTTALAAWRRLRHNAAALNAGRIAGAGLDVLSIEPPHPHNPLLSARNCLVTPHIAWATREARTRLMGLVVENLAAFLAGNPQNVVS